MEHPLKNFQYLRDIECDLSSDSFPQGDEETLHILLLADDAHEANVVQDHIAAFRNSSRHLCTVVNPRTAGTGRVASVPFDAIIIHYSIFILSSVYLPEEWANHVRAFEGPKSIIHEDEYQRVNEFTNAIVDLGISAVFSCLDSPETLAKVYSAPELSDISFFSCLPGYIPDSLQHLSPVAIEDRPLDIVYRGRDLAPQLGRFAQEKSRIGKMVGSLAQRYNLKVDLTSKEDERIYGPAWLDFLQSGKVMLGVEGGASIFDFDGQIAEQVDAYKAASPDAEFEEIWQALLSEHEGNVEFRTITPKFFEAVMVKTALVLFPGHYSGILQPDRHYIPLAPDGSNFTQVAEKISDTDYLQDLVDRTYAEIGGREDLRMRFYVEKIDIIVSEQVKKRTSTRNAGGGVTNIQMQAGQNLVSADLARDEPSQTFAKVTEHVNKIADALNVIDAKLLRTDKERTWHQGNLSTLRSDFETLQREFSTYKQDLAAHKKELAGHREEIAGQRKELAGQRKELAGHREEIAAQKKKLNAHERTLDNFRGYLKLRQKIARAKMLIQNTLSLPKT